METATIQEGVAQGQNQEVKKGKEGIRVLGPPRNVLLLQLCQ
jgi:hypothetical protein